MEGDGRRLLVSSPHFWIREHRATDRPMPLKAVPECRILAVAGGRVEAGTGHETLLQLEPGSTVLVPAAYATTTLVHATGTATLLEIGFE